ncbi:hypothetical protein CAOG_01906 [Capsaspora owczarzaki ATCC 30864]|uniref:hypothetical protein n=1 Tax=Capsaspora owczarzaki (strain ATCC 30864) TaxID=595528 RepID=UPI0003527024|nr:hypothetical protein CAOG_01906 [Capsaspora owczarzaki ATCC 30864]|eukprot:XP_004364774.2 hypothetical protein CAOG_01906 [Capsaspora owczarzaki ATCC 30864]
MKPDRRLVQFELDPTEGSLGGFTIGMPISSVIGYLNTKLRDEIPQCELIYSASNPLALHISINLPATGLRLRIDAVSQRLVVIEVLDMFALTLRFAGKIISGPRTPLTFVNVQKHFGPTSPGRYDDARQQYIHAYSGFALYFAIPSKHQAFVKNSATFGMFPDGTTPVAAKICLYHGKWDRPTLPPLPLGSLYMQKVVVDVRHGLHFPLERTVVRFGDTCQDVFSELGAPNHVFHKADVRAIVATNSRQGSDSDYFYNYFDRGLDVLFDAQTHSVKKFILHCNFPGHFDFNRYSKCNFRLLGSSLVARHSRSAVGPASKQPASFGELDGEPPTEVLVDVSGPVSTSSKRNRDADSSRGSAEAGVHENPFNVDLASVLADDPSENDPYETVKAQECRVIHPNMTWDAVQHLIGRPRGKPAVYNKEVTLNPFGTVQFHGFNGAIFEIMNNNHIASVTVFRPAVATC